MEIRMKRFDSYSGSRGGPPPAPRTERNHLKHRSRVRDHACALSFLPQYLPPLSSFLTLLLIDHLPQPQPIGGGKISTAIIAIFIPFSCGFISLLKKCFCIFFFYFSRFSIVERDQGLLWTKDSWETRDPWDLKITKVGLPETVGITPKIAMQITNPRDACMRAHNGT